MLLPFAHTAGGPARSKKGRFRMAVSSLEQAVAAVCSCLVRLKNIADAGRPYPAWSQNPPNPETVKLAIEENSPSLQDSFSRLDECYRCRPWRAKSSPQQNDR